jgi:hypothetical protein
LSDIVDEDYGFTLNGVSGINLGNSGREFFSTDRKIPDKKVNYISNFFFILILSSFN